MAEAFFDRFDFDEDSPESAAAALELLRDGIQHYQTTFVPLVNDVPEIDLPLFLAAIRMSCDALRASLPESGQEGMDAILDLPFSTTLVQYPRGAHHGD